MKKKITFYKKYEEKYVFEGEQREKYKRSILKWFVLSCFSVFFPPVITIIIDLYEKTFNMFNLINNGDLILLSFSLTIPTILDMLEMKKSTTTKKDDVLIACGCLCLFIIVIQTLFYALIRTHKTMTAINLFLTVAIVFSSIYICRYSVFCMFISSIKEEQV